jgi:hypothetical protein
VRLEKRELGGGEFGKEDGYVRDRGAGASELLRDSLCGNETLVTSWGRNGITHLKLFKASLASERTEDDAPKRRPVFLPNGRREQVNALARGLDSIITDVVHLAVAVIFARELLCVWVVAEGWDVRIFNHDGLEMKAAVAKVSAATGLSCEST